MKTSSFVIIILSLSALSFLIGCLSSNLIGKSITGQAIEENHYTYTKAICNNNQCLDILIECKNQEVISLTPLTNLKNIPQDFHLPSNQTFCE